MSDRSPTNPDRHSTAGQTPPAREVTVNAPTIAPQSCEPELQNTKRPLANDGTSIPGTVAATSNQAEQHIGVGTELGYYRLVKKLGEGGMGSVWLALHTKLDKQVAVKVLPATWSRDPALLTRFEREMKAVGKLEHPHIVRAMDAGEFQGTHYLVMEFNEGQDLSLWVKSRGPQSVSNACEMVRQAALGLAHAHDAGLIHRDIKPSNLFLTKSGKVKILDLGLARVQGDSTGGGQTLTGFGQVLGTPDYMAPEQWENTHTADGRSDLYALGCTLFYLLTGRAPFSDERHSSLVGKMKGHTLDPIPDLKSARLEAVADRPKLANDLVSDELDALYRKLMSKRADGRFASATELAEALTAFGKSKAGASGVLVKESPPVVPSSSVAPRPESRTSLNATSATAPLIMTEFEPAAPAEPSGTGDAPSFLEMFAEASSSTQHDAPASGRLPHGASVSGRASPKSDHSLARRAKPSRLKLGLILSGLAALILFGVIVFKITKKDGTNLEVADSDDTVTVEITESPSNRKASRKASASGRSKKSEQDQDRGLTPSGSPTKNTGWHGWPVDAPPPAIAPFDAEQAQQHQEAWAKYLGVPVEYTNSLGMKFRLIPPGEFMMGSTPEEIEEAIKLIEPSDKHWEECIRSEAPKRNVVLTQPLYLGVHEVTQAEYEKVMGKNPSHFSPIGAGKDAVTGMDTMSHPVEHISWNDSAEFCVKLSQQDQFKPFYFRAGETVTLLDGTGYRLPTEVEREFAARAGTTTKYWIGDKDEDLVQAGWFVTNSGGRTHAVGELKANPFGFLDIHGNVWEWAQDWWEPTYSRKSPDDLAGGPSEPSIGSRRVIRGGSFYFPVSYSRASTRLAYEPTGPNINIGFRVSLTLEAARQALKVTGPAMPKTVATTPSASASDIAADRKTAESPMKPGDLPQPKPAPVASSTTSNNPTAPDNKSNADSKKSTTDTVASLTPNKTAPIKRPAFVIAPKVSLAKEPFKTKPGTPISPRAMVWSPAPIRELSSWSVELVGHVGGVSSMALSPDGAFAATGSGGDDSIHIWRINEGVAPPTITLDRVLVGESGAVWDVAWSPDGQALAVTSHHGHNVTVYDAVNGRKLNSYSLEGGGGRSVQWSPDGRWISAPNLGSLLMVDAVVGKAVRSKVGLSGVTGCWAPDGRQLATLDEEGKLKVWNPIKLEIVMEVTASNRGLNGGVAWSPDGRWIATGAVDGHVKVWDASTRRVVHDVSGEQSEVYFVAWEPKPPEGVEKHPNWPRLLSTGSGRAVIWDGVQGKKLVGFDLGGHTLKGAWTPDARRVIGIRNNRPALFDAESGGLLAEASMNGEADFQGWSSHATADGKIVRVLNGPELLIFNGELGDYVKRVGNMPSSTLSHSPKDDWLAIYDPNKEQDQLVLVDTATYEQRRPLNGHVGKVSGVNWSPDGKLLASAGVDRVVRIWKVASGETSQQIKHDRAVRSVIWSPDGKSLATCAEDDIIRIFNADSGKELRKFDALPSPPAWGPTGIAWAPVGDLIAIAAWDAQARVLDVKSGKLSDPFVQFLGSMQSVAWSTDGKQLLVSNGNEIGYRAVSAKTSQLVYGHGLPMQWLNDKRRVLTGQGGAHPLQAVDTRRGSRLGVLFPSLRGGGWLCIGPDGHYRGSEEVEKHLVYVALHKDGSQLTYSAAEFREKFGWKNDPAKARLLKLDDVVTK